MSENGWASEEELAEEFDFVDQVEAIGRAHYDLGYSCGYDIGESVGYDNGSQDGYRDGLKDWFDDGYWAGNKDGLLEGLDAGEESVQA